MILEQVKGMAFNKGIALSPREEKENAGRSGWMLGRIQMLYPCYTHVAASVHCHPSQAA